MFLVLCLRVPAPRRLLQCSFSVFRDFAHPPICFILRSCEWVAVIVPRSLGSSALAVCKCNWCSANLLLSNCSAPCTHILRHYTHIVRCVFLRSHFGKNREMMTTTRGRRRRRRDSDRTTRGKQNTWQTDETTENNKQMNEQQTTTAERTNPKESYSNSYTMFSFSVLRRCMRMRTTFLRYFNYCLRRAAGICNASELLLVQRKWSTQQVAWTMNGTIRLSMSNCLVLYDILFLHIAIQILLFSKNSTFLYTQSVNPTNEQQPHSTLLFNLFCFFFSFRSSCYSVRQIAILGVECKSHHQAIV